MALLLRLKRTVRAALQVTAAPTTSVMDALLQLELSREFMRLQSELIEKVPENPAAHGFKVYSQADEDGILEEICKRIGLDAGVFVEIGCGDGRENNTHYLLLKGWRGVWVDGNAAHIATIRRALPASDRLRVLEAMVTRENVVELLTSALGPQGSLDLLSVDVDGNDLAIVQAVIAAYAPKLVVAEYNAKFPYPLALGVTYDSNRAWQGDDYHGASLAAWTAGLHPDFQLVCCNLAGTNAFFVRKELAQPFGNHAPERLYQPARFHLTALRVGHTPTLAFLADSLATDKGDPRSGSPI
jgi:hypothetical protein